MLLPSASLKGDSFISRGLVALTVVFGILLPDEDVEFFVLASFPACHYSGRSPKSNQHALHRYPAKILSFTRATF